MAYVIRSRNTTALLDDFHEHLFDVIVGWDMGGPQCEVLRHSCSKYEDVRMTSREQVERFRAEIESFRLAYIAHKTADLVRSRRVRARDPQVRRAIVNRLLADDTWLAVLVDIVAACDDAIATDGVVVCEHRQHACGLADLDKVAT